MLYCVYVDCVLRVCVCVDVNVLCVVVDTGSDDVVVVCGDCLRRCDFVMVMLLLRC